MTHKVLVTGASGFIGQALVPALARAGWAVRAASRKPPPMTAEAIEHVSMPDLTRGADWHRLLDGVTHAVHLAGIAHAPGNLPEDLYKRINAGAVGEIAQRAATNGVERLVFISSVRAQAGLSSDHPITEAEPPQPTDAYGRSKLEAERLLAASGARFTVLRPAVVYGKGVKGNIASLATLAKTPMPLPFAGLHNLRSLLALENLVDAIALTLTSEQAAGETFLVADSEPISVADMVAAMREGLGRPPHLVPMPHGAIKRLMASFGREADWERIAGSFVVDAGKLGAIGWSPRVKTREGLARMMRGSGANGSYPSP